MSPTPAPTPRPTAAAPSPESSRTERERAIDTLLGGKKQKPEGPPEDDTGEIERTDEKTVIVVDPDTGQRLQKVPKNPTLFVKDGRLFSAIITPTIGGIPLVRQDEKYYYIAAPREPSPEEIAKRQARNEASAAALPQIFEVPKEEAELVTPRISKKRIRLESQSVGLPKNGMWRENFALADIDGDGRPEIISPPPRLSAQGLRIFKWTGERWRSVTPLMENPDNLTIGYGGVATGDLDGDGRTDVVVGGHGQGVWAGWNLGNMKFRIARRGLPPGMSTRAMAVGDLDGDGKPDVVVLSDTPEGPGKDVRAYMNNGDHFVELVAGLEDGPCFGYSLALETRPVDKGAPFFVTSCNYAMGTNLLYEFDRARMAFKNVSDPVVELYSVGMGVAVGTYRGHPAAFTTYFKNRPAGAVPDPSGDGLSIYYRDGGEWKRFRVLKRLGMNRGLTPAIGVADLDGDGLDDIVVADNVERKVRVFFQTPAGEFEELDPALEPDCVNFPTSLRIADVDGDGRLDIVLMTQYMTVSETKEGGFRFFRNLPVK
ncbi:MAG: FG-GAP repeat domain-containing protein [Thermoanaerobaculia bacterium]